MVKKKIKLFLKRREVKKLKNFIISGVIVIFFFILFSLLISAETLTIVLTAGNLISGSSEEKDITKIPNPNLVLSQNVWEGYRVLSKTGNESKLFDVRIEGNEIYLDAKDKVKVTKKECKYDEEKKKNKCKDITYYTPQNISLRTNSRQKIIKKTTSAIKDFFSYTAIPFIDTWLKFGEESIIIEGETSYNSTDTNITQETGFAHLNLTENFIESSPGSSSSVILTAGNVTKDGDVEYDDLEATYTGYWSNSYGYIDFAIDTESRVIYEFNTSDIPAGATINKVILNVSISSGATTETCSVYEMEGRPLIDGDESLFNDAKNGTAYVSGSDKCQSTGYQEFELIGANTTLESQLSEDWFAVGMTINDGEIDGATLETVESSNDPQLIVTYTTAGSTKQINVSTVLYMPFDYKAKPNWTAGKVGNALDFDGVNDYVDCGNTESLNITEEITVMAWVRNNINVTTDDKWKGIVAKDKSYMLRTTKVADSADFEFFIYNGSWEPRANSYIVPDPNTWYHVVGTFNGTYLKIYVNGSLKNSTARHTTISTSVNPVKIGYWFDYFNGTIDEARIWNRSLSATEILNIYNNESAGQYDSNMNRTGLVGEWHLNETKGLTASDNSGSSNDGTLTNFETSYPRDYSKYNNDGSPIQAPKLISNGFIGSAYNFTLTSDDYINIPDSDSVDVYEGEDFTISLWVTSDAPTTDNQVILNKYSGSSTPGYYIFYDDSGSGDQVGVRAKLYGASSSATELYQNKNLHAGWNHIVFSRNTGEDKVYLYIDGVLNTSATDDTIGSSANSNDLHIGYGFADYANDWGGLIDEVMMYNRSLNSSEILDLYNNQTKRFMHDGDMLFQNIVLGANNDSVNISLEDCQNYKGSNLSAKINNGSWINFTNCNIIAYNLTNILNLDDANLTIKFLTGTYDFYSPIIIRDINLYPYNSTGVAPPPTIYPDIFIDHPTSTNYTINDLDINISSTNDTGYWWWSNNSFANNYSVTAIGTNLTVNDFPEGSTTLYIGRNDSANNLNQTSVMFTVDTIFPDIFIDSPTNIT